MSINVKKGITFNYLQPYIIWTQVSLFYQTETSLNALLTSVKLEINTKKKPLQNTLGLSLYNHLWFGQNKNLNSQNKMWK